MLTQSMAGKTMNSESDNASRQSVGTLLVDSVFLAFVEEELLPAIGIEAGDFWQGLESLIDDLTPINRALLTTRDDLQAQIDEWHKARSGQRWDHDQYIEFLRTIGYLIKPGEPFQITTTGVDREIATIAGPQLVVPVSNARFVQR
jgi:malate synthase